MFSTAAYLPAGLAGCTGMGLAQRSHLPLRATGEARDWPAFSWGFGFTLATSSGCLLPTL